jgi:hypothetical protein
MQVRLYERLSERQHHTVEFEFEFEFEFSVELEAGAYTQGK